MSAKAVTMSANGGPIGEDRRGYSNTDLVSSLKEDYKNCPWIDVDSELVKMKAWISANKGRRLTYRFAVKWLNKNEKPLDWENKSW